MRKKTKLKSFFHLAGTYTLPVAGIISSLYVGILSLNVNADYLKNRPIVSACIDKFQSYSIEFFILIAIISSIGIALKKVSDPWVDELLQKTLDHYQTLCFDTGEEDPKDHNRVTIFKAERCCFKRHWTSQNWWEPWGKTKPFSRYLVPYMRSHHQSQQTNALFFIPDNSDGTEGIAGKAWSTKRTALALNLPDINGKNTQMARFKKNMEKYAEETKCSLDMVKKYIDAKHPLPLSIVAIPLEVNFKQWGVIVIDSRRQDGASARSVDNFRLTIKLIERLLEKSK